MDPSVERSIPSAPEGGSRGTWADAAPDRWCVGLPIVAHRPLYPDEVAQLVTQRARRRIYLALGVLLLVAPFCTIFIAVALSVKRHGGHASPLGFAFSLLFLLCVAPCIGAIATLRAATQLRALRRELAAAELLKFAGPVLVHRFRHGPAATLVRTGDVKPGGTHVLEVLGPTGRLVRVDGRSPRARLFFGISSTAAPPKRAEIAAQWLRPVQLKGGQQIMHGSRALGADEEGELAKHVAHFMRRSGIALVVLFLNVALFGFAARSSWPLSIRIGVCVAVGAATLFDGGKIANVVRLFWNLRRDLRAKQIVIVQMPPKDGGPALPPVEILVHSRLQWTQMGQPAPWRAAAYTVPRAF